MSIAPTRTSIQLYRDLLRLISHVSPGHTPKSHALRTRVRATFAENANVSGVELENAKAAAVRALANYMLIESAGSENSGQLKEKSAEFFEREKPR